MKQRTCRVVSWRLKQSNGYRYWVTMACGHQMWMETARRDGPTYSTTCQCLIKAALAKAGV